MSATALLDTNICSLNGWTALALGPALDGLGGFEDVRVIVETDRHRCRPARRRR
jgi:hypothetical protein